MKSGSLDTTQQYKEMMEGLGKEVAVLERILGGGKSWEVVQTYRGEYHALALDLEIFWSGFLWYKTGYFEVLLTQQIPV